MNTAKNPVLIEIDPSFIISYASYYIYGIKKLLPDAKIKFRMLDVAVNDEEDYRSGIAIRLIYADGEQKNLFIDFHDSDIIRKKYHEWADTYAKINLKAEDESDGKAISIGPSFGIRLWNPVKTVLKAVGNYRKYGDSIPVPFRTYLRDYCYMFVRRKSFSHYCRPAKEDSDYVFTLSTLWYDEQTYSSTNRYRGIYAKACKRVFPRFEGGFFYIPDDSVERKFPKYREYLSEYSDLLTNRRIPMSDYLRNTAKSAIVFNTPSVLGCHGWKMAEYLAMGKAVISTPLNNVMPGDFNPMREVYTVSTPEEIETAVQLLYHDKGKREKLKSDARKYFERFLAPEAVVRRILDTFAK